jgi:ubiquinone/menaquinone biosynthesis C-methylase UbiE
MSDKKSLAKQYDNFASEFSSAITEKNRINRTSFYNQIDFPLKGKKLLDLACGDGSDMVYYESLGAKTCGIDASKELVEIALAKLPESDIRVGLMEKLPYADKSFDLVFSKYAIQHSSDVAPIMREAARVIKPGGIFMYLVTHPIRQFLEKRRSGKDYFTQEVVRSVLFDGLITIEEPSHTFNQYLNKEFLKNFDVIGYEEVYDPLSAEHIGEDKYPGFFILKARSRS